MIKSLCNEPCVNCPTVQWNTKGTNEAQSHHPWLTFVKPLPKVTCPEETVGYTDIQQRDPPLTGSAMSFTGAWLKTGSCQPSRTVSTLWSSGQKGVWNNPQLLLTLKSGAQCPQSLPSHHSLMCHWCSRFPSSRRKVDFFLCTCSLWAKLLSLHLRGFLWCHTPYPLCWINVTQTCPCGSHQGYHDQRPGEEHVPSEQRPDSSAALVVQSSCHSFTTTQCRKGDIWISLEPPCMELALIIWTGAHSDWDFLNKPVVILAQPLWFSSQMP